jgi:hypothetical protein
MPLPALPWPETTPDNLPFPYSHFGDPLKRVALLQRIGQVINLKPSTVVNLGAGYDITPSIAFPDARVIHTEIIPEAIRFLGRIGFEVYSPEDTPDLKADLAISILGPNLHSLNNKLADQAFYISTAASGRYIPEDMAVIGLVNDELQMCTNIDEIENMWEGTAGLHLGVYATRIALTERGMEGLVES